MTNDPRGPIRIVTNVEKGLKTKTGEVIRLTFDCGCTGNVVPHRPDAYRVGDDARAFGCKHN